MLSFSDILSCVKNSSCCWSSSELRSVKDEFINLSVVDTIVILFVFISGLVFIFLNSVSIKFLIFFEKYNWKYVCVIIRY